MRLIPERCLAMEQPGNNQDPERPLEYDGQSMLIGCDWLTRHGMRRRIEAH